VAVGAENSLLGGRYRVERVLGSGGMATVFLCKDERLGRSVAVKRLHAHSPEETAQRFVREAKLGASLNHPNLVSVFDTITDDESVLIVMEHVDGLNLADTLRKGPLGTERALSVVRDVAAALDHAHGQGVVHRDVKPANVLLRKDGMTKLVDLGIATAADQTKITRSGVVLGTAAYMAPEQIEGGEMTPHTDIYSLAVVAYEALSGKRARSGRTPMEIAHQVATDGPPDLQEVWSQAPPEAAAVLCRGMAHDPDHRPGSAGELSDELTKALSGVDDTRPTRRSPRTVAAGAAGGAALAGGAAAGAAASDGAAGNPAADATPTPTPQREPPPSRREQPARSARSGGQPPRPPARAGSSGRGPTPYGRQNGDSKSRSGLAAGAAALLVVAAAVLAVALISSGGDNGQTAQNKPPAKTTQHKQTKTSEQPAAQTEQQPAQSTPAPASGGTGPAEGARLDAQGFRLIQQGQYAQAVPIERRAVASFPNGDTSANHAFALFNLGTALNRSGKPGEAIPYLEKRLSFSNDRRDVVQKELDSARKNSGG
jgi:serine/threonine protein kinase